jgi:hypothetical protein
MLSFNYRHLREQLKIVGNIAVNANGYTTNPQKFFSGAIAGSIRPKAYSNQLCRVAKNNIFRRVQNKAETKIM